MARRAETTGPEMANRDLNPDLVGFGVYVHWPFCASKCPYCDFNSHVRHGGVDQAGYLAGYRQEIRAIRALIGPRRVSSIFFGGGTPSLMEPATVEAILSEIAQCWQIEDGVEITLEANPSSVEAGCFAGYRAAGVNRVSLGVQALIEADLKALGRLHSVDDARRAIDIAATTFERHSFDLIYARPGQSLAQWEAELRTALALGTRHLSLYQLTIEEGTPFADLYDKGRLRIPAARQAEDMLELTRAITAAHGLPAYETSNHAAPGEESRHNLLYWRYGEFAGIGAGAHGRLIVDGERYATSNERVPERWLARVETEGTGQVEFERLSRGEMADELLLMSLRLTEGLDLGRLAGLCGVEPAADVVAALLGEGLVSRDGNRLRATAAGSFVLNEIVLQLTRELHVIAAETKFDSNLSSH